MHTLSYFCGLLIVDCTYISHNYFKATGSIAFPLKQNLTIDQKRQSMIKPCAYFIRPLICAFQHHVASIIVRTAPPRQASVPVVMTATYGNQQHKPVTVCITHTHVCVCACVRACVCVCVCVCAVPLKHSQSYPKSSQNTPHSSPLRARYGVSFVGWNSD